uniref:hypothetical protein n=1 Tax=Thaumasiovibrio occultus TaxID=1891184 RepID=UPI000B34D091|nr:hypothetical protein [Thaumasiovibrio occultus]
MSQTLTLIEQNRLDWMTSHVNESPYPTPESVQGLAAYLNVSRPLDALTPLHRPELTLYEVDCHPLMIRYARLLAQKWPEQEQPLLIEFLTQLDKDPSGNAKLYLGYEGGAPVATAMRYVDENHFVIADVHANEQSHAQGLLAAILADNEGLDWLARED